VGDGRPGNYDFAGKVIFITGAAHGQGRAAALAFAQAGAHVAAFDLAADLDYPAYALGNSADLAALANEVAGFGGSIKTYAGDVRIEDSIAAAVDDAAQTFGRIDILFNNAGIGAYAHSWEMNEHEWDMMLDINLKGAWLTAKHVIPYLIEQKSGVIINNSSIAGLRGFRRMSHYCASKWGLVGLTKSWALELAPYNVRVISLHPTGVNTPFNDGLAEIEGKTAIEIAEQSAGNLLDTPWIETDDVVEALFYLASDKARFVTGSQFVLDAGLLST
jgi:NAD(P)-dependent dehydrogenase (short-subunit alcohol dehydrogenase family)